jgi:hypothetical protein
MAPATSVAGSRFCQYTIGAMASKAAVTSAKGNDFFGLGRGTVAISG